MLVSAGVEVLKVGAAFANQALLEPQTVGIHVS